MAVYRKTFPRWKDAFICFSCTTKLAVQISLPSTHFILNYKRI
uniref:Uncharacterized protein n=1 Tax=Zea mays TaxID=4577 RepID=B4FM87_MAIZE|nr:unknown [Zea mays]